MLCYLNLLGMIMNRFEFKYEEAKYLNLSAYDPAPQKSIYRVKKDRGGLVSYYIFLKREIEDWMIDNDIDYEIEQHLQVSDRYLDFKTIDDLLLFKLTWGGR